jgi:hypothetical protein
VLQETHFEKMEVKESRLDIVDDHDWGSVLLLDEESTDYQSQSQLSPRRELAENASVPVSPKAAYDSGADSIEPTICSCCMKLLYPHQVPEKVALEPTKMATSPCQTTITLLESLEASTCGADNIGGEPKVVPSPPKAVERDKEKVPEAGSHADTDMDSDSQLLDQEIGELQILNTLLVNRIENAATSSSGLDKIFIEAQSRAHHCYADLVFQQQKMEEIATQASQLEKENRELCAAIDLHHLELKHKDLEVEMASYRTDVRDKLDIHRTLMRGPIAVALRKSS